ncbi:MAG: RHS repeat-associated core domain-containing protein, partial [Bdellovibrionota bacterium]
SVPVTLQAGSQTLTQSVLIADLVAMGNNKTLSFIVTFPPAEAGVKTLVTNVNSSRLFIESNYANNESSQAIQVRSRDLITDGVKISSGGVVFDSRINTEPLIIFTGGTVNIEILVSITFNQDPTLSDLNTLVTAKLVAGQHILTKEVSLQSLVTNKSVSFELSFEETDVGVISLATSINHDNKLFESNLANNSNSFPQIASIASLPDLIAVINSFSPMCAANSAINMDTLSLQETIPLVGIDFTLNHYSEYQLSNSSYKPKDFGLGGWLPSILHKYDITKKLIFYGYGGASPTTAISAQNTFLIPDRSGDEIYVFDANGVHIQTKDALTGVIKYNFIYNSNGKISAITDRFGNSTTFAYSNDQVLIQSPYAQVTTLALNVNGFLTSATSPQNEVYNITNNDIGLITEFQKPKGEKSFVTYDSNGRVQKDTGAGGDFLSLLREFNSSTREQTVNMSTALGRETTFKTISSVDGAIHTSIAPTGQSYTSSVQYQGNQSSIDSIGTTTQSMQAEDPRFGWLSPYEKSSSYTINNSNINIQVETNKIAVLSDSNNPLSATQLTTTTKLQNDPDRIYSSTYSTSNRTLTSTSPLNRASVVSFTPQGQASKIQIGDLVPVNLSYDTRGRLTQVAQQNRKSSFTYNQQGNIQSSKDPLGLISSYQYDNSNRPIKIRNPDGSIILMAYDKNSNLASITPPSRSPHEFRFNLAELLSAYIPPNLSGQISGATQYEHNLDKQLTQINRPDGTEINFDYNNTTGLLNKIRTARGNYLFNYQQNSNLVSQLTSPDNEILRYQYVGDILTQVNAIGTINSSLHFFYNTDATISKIEVSTEENRPYGGISLSYDMDNLLIKSGNLSYTRNAVGDINASVLGEVSEKINFDNFGQMSEVKFQTSKKKDLYSAKFYRDDLGRVVSAIEDHDSEDHENNKHLKQYKYDKQGRLIAAYKNTKLVRAYKFDQNGNRIEANYHGKNIQAKFDAQDRLISYGKNSYQYNNNGDLIAKFKNEKDDDDDDHKHKNKHATRYNFDVFGNLKSVLLPNNKKIEYIIDGQNRRIGKKINGKLVQGFIYQSQTQVAAELDGSGKLVKRFIYGEKINVPDYMIYQNKEYRIISDQVGTPRLVVEASSGKIVEKIEMDEFGHDVRIEGKNLIPFGFAGGIYDQDTGLVRFGARDYDPEIGRWTSKDPIGFAGGDTNLYAYCGGDSVNCIDPEGEFAIPIVIGLAYFLYGSLTDTPGQGQFEKDRLRDLAGFFVSGGVQVATVRGVKNTPDQAALIDIAKQMQRTGMTPAQAATMRRWANEYKVPFRGPEVHPNRPFGKEPHYHVGPVDHIRMCK